MGNSFRAGLCGNSVGEGEAQYGNGVKETLHVGIGIFSLFLLSRFLPNISHLFPPVSFSRLHAWICSSASVSSKCHFVPGDTEQEVPSLGFPRTSFQGFIQGRWLQGLHPSSMNPEMVDYPDVICGHEQTSPCSLPWDLLQPPSRRCHHKSRIVQRKPCPQMMFLRDFYRSIHARPCPRVRSRAGGTGRSPRWL